MACRVKLMTFEFASPRPGSSHWTCTVGAELTEGTLAEGQFLGFTVAGAPQSYIVARIYKQVGEQFEPTSKATTSGPIRLELKLTPQRHEQLATNPPAPGTMADEVKPLMGLAP